MTDDEIRQKAINKVGVDVLEAIRNNIDTIKEAVNGGNSNLTKSDLDFLVKGLTYNDERIDMYGAMKYLNCSQRYFNDLVKKGIIRKLKSIKGIFSERDIDVAIEESKIRRKEGRK